MKRKIQLFVCALALLTATGASVALAPCLASDLTQNRDPVFVGVEQVKVQVLYVDGTRKQNDASSVPSSLQRQSLEALLADLYERRFSSSDCDTFLGGRAAYECNDQPIAIEQDFAKSETGKIVGDPPGTLRVILHFIVRPSPLDSDQYLIAAYLIQERPEPEINAYWKMSAPLALVANPTSVSETYREISNYVSTFIQ